jgi:hypothetical protein
MFLGLPTIARDWMGPDHQDCVIAARASSRGASFWCAAGAPDGSPGGAGSARPVREGAITRSGRSADGRRNHADKVTPPHSAGSDAETSANRERGKKAAARPTNTAAWLRTRRCAIEVGPAQYTPPRENEIVVRNRAVAVNPAELMRRCRRQEIQLNRREIRVTMVNGATLRNDEVSTAVYQDFLPAALAVGAYQGAPEPRVIGHGLQHIPAALETQRSGVSATKIVVSLDAG